MSKLIVNQLQAYSGSLITFTDGTSAYISGSLVVVGSTTAASISATTLTGTLSTAAQTNITSVGTLSSLAVSGNATFDTTTLVVDASNNRVGVNIASPSVALDISGTGKYTDVNTTTYSSANTLGSGTSLHIVNNAATNNAAATIRLDVTGGDTSLAAATISSVWTGFASSDITFGTRIGESDVTERMRITSSGYVGIGESNPAFPLHIKSSTDIVQFESTTNGLYNQYKSTVGIFGYVGSASQTVSGGATTDFGIQSPLGGFVIATGGNTERMRIDSSGNVGIGTDNPTRLLSISATNPSLVLKSTTTTGFSELYFGDSAADNGFIGYAHNGDYMYFGTSGTERMRITNVGNVGIGGSPSQTLTIQKTGYPIIDFNDGTAVKGDIGYNTATGTFNIGAYSTTPMAFYANGSERMRIDSSGNVGIGASPAVRLTVSNNTNNYIELNSTVANVQTALNITNTTSTKRATLSWEDGTRGDYADLYSSTYLSITTGSSEKMRILSSGGITFNGDTSSANALDDYEEGTWTMGISFGGASTGVTYSNNTGAYTKIGRQVTVTGLMILSSKGTATGNAKITGLPFTVLSNISAYSPPVLRLERVAYIGNAQAYGAPNTTNIDLEQQASGGDASSLYDTDFVDNSTIMLSLTYFV